MCSKTLAGHRPKSRGLLITGTDGTNKTDQSDDLYETAHTFYITTMVSDGDVLIKDGCVML
jgi:hypothetical protein